MYQLRTSLEPTSKTTCSACGLEIRFCSYENRVGNSIVTNLKPIITKGDDNMSAATGARLCVCSHFTLLERATDLDCKKLQSI